MKKRYSEEQIIKFLREADAGMPVKDLCPRRGAGLRELSAELSKAPGAPLHEAHRLSPELRRSGARATRI